MEGLDPKTDREIMILLASKMDTLSTSIEKFAGALEKLEATKIADLDKRVENLEKWQNEVSGVYKFFVIIATVLGAASVLIQLFKK